MSGIGGGGPKSPPASAVYMNLWPQKKISLHLLARDDEIRVMTSVAASGGSSGHLASSTNNKSVTRTG